MADRHNYRTCRDPECRRLACLAYREGYLDGFGDGLDTVKDGAA